MKAISIEDIKKWGHKPNHLFRLVEQQDIMIAQNDQLIAQNKLIIVKLEAIYSRFYFGD